MNSNSRLMIAVVAALLIAGASGVLAQQPDGVPGGASVGQTAPNSWRGGQTTGQLGAPAEQSKPSRSGEAQPNRNRETTGQGPQNESRENQNAEWRENRTEGNKATNGATEERRLEQNRVTKERERDKDRNRATTGQGATPTK
jgi:opacity protein-like surface antigen